MIIIYKKNVFSIKPGSYWFLSQSATLIWMANLQYKSPENRARICHNETTVLSSFVLSLCNHQLIDLKTNKKDGFFLYETTHQKHIHGPCNHHIWWSSWRLDQNLWTKIVQKTYIVRANRRHPVLRAIQTHIHVLIASYLKYANFCHKKSKWLT